MACLAMPASALAAADNTVTQIPVPPASQTPATIAGIVEGASPPRKLAFGRSGRVAKIDVKVGEQVRKGQTLAVLECADAKADLATLEAEWELQQLTFQKRVRAADPGGLEVAKDRLALAEADLLAAEASRTRLETAANETALFSRQERDAAARRVTVARLDVSTAKGTLDRLQNGLSADDESEMAIRERIYKAKASRYRYDLSLCEITSPVAGIVTESRKVSGELASAFETALSIAEDGDWRVSVCVPDADERVEIGQKLRVRLPAGQTKVFQAQVSRVGPPMSDTSTNYTSCPMAVWLDPAEKIAAPPLGSRAYVHLR